MDEKTIEIPKELPSEITEKYTVEENTFKQEVSDNPKDRIEVIIGDDKQTDFKPQVKIQRWDNEVNFSIRAEEHPDAVVEVESEVIKYITPEYEVHQYDKPGASENGGFEFEWILKSKPSSNVLIATVQTKGLDFFYQPELTQQEIDDGDSRPENVVGSYAVYHSTKGVMNDVVGMEYKVGKAFHIYRPKVTDANGNEIWGELNIDVQNGFLVVTIDQAWLDSAVYPVIVDPTVGYTSIGASNSALYDDPTGAIEDFGRRGNLFTGIDGEITSLSLYISNDHSSDTNSIAIMINQKDSVAANSHGQTGIAEDTSVADAEFEAWKTITTSINVTAGNTYIINATASGPDSVGATNNAKFDANGVDRLSEQFTNASIPAGYAAAKEDPWTDSVDSGSNQYSIYATYTATGGSLIKTHNGLAIASVKTVNGLAIASVKTVDGLTNV